MPATNLFVEGDNLEVLGRVRALVGEVDLVVTDPPYNTGGTGFVYADDLRGDATTDRHAAWVGWLRPRLQAVRAVLRPTGAVAVSIDDHEVAHLRLLMDEVLGEANFLAQVVVELNPKGRQLGRGFATSHEYVLLHAADAARCVLRASTVDGVDRADFPYTAADGRPYRRLPLRNTNKKFNPATARSLHFALWGDPDDGRVAATPFPGAVEVWPVFGDGAPAVWRWSRPLVEERGEDLVCRRVQGRLGERVDVYQRDWWHEERRKKLRTVWHAAEVGSTDSAVVELKALVGHVFESPKPTGLVRRLLATMPDDAVVLDPFAGSGTTGHAVALANAEDGGTRRCLSIDVGTPVRPGSNAAAAGHATVADVTRARLRAVAETVGGGFEDLTGR